MGKMKITIEIKNALNSNKLIVAELEASSKECSRWLGIYSIESGYRVRTFELPNQYIENDYDVDESDLVNSKDYYVNGLDELQSLLENEFNQTIILTCPWKTDYPL